MSSLSSPPRARGDDSWPRVKDWLRKTLRALQHSVCFCAFAANSRPVWDLGPGRASRAERDLARMRIFDLEHTLVARELQL